MERWPPQRLVLLAFIATLAPAALGMANGAHRARDERPLHITAALQRRDATVCTAGYVLCPSSLGGDCCPTDHLCGTSSCFPISTTLSSGCSSSGYVPCGSAQSGGCCPVGHTCLVNGCLPPGATYSQTCGVNSYLCPTSIALGCCPNGLACGTANCYHTSFEAVSLTLTVTTTISSSITQTMTTVVQTTYSAAPIQVVAVTNTVPKIPSTASASAVAVAKIPASDPSSGGLSQAQLGGIIGAAVTVVIVVCVATFIILRRLNTVAKAAKAASKSRSKSRSNSSRPRPHGPTASGGSNDYSPAANMSLDPLIMSDAGTNAHGPSRPSAVHNSRSDLQPMRSPPVPAPYGSPPGWSGAYQQVPLSESQYADLTGHYRHTSREIESPDRSYSPPDGTSTGYFDSDPALRDQNLRFGHQPRPSVTTHGRQWSDASDVSHQSGSSGIVELDAGPDGDRRSSLQRAIQGVGFIRMPGGRRSTEHRRRSNSGGTVPWGMAAAPGMSARLENVVESEHDMNSRDMGVSKATAEATTSGEGLAMGSPGSQGRQRSHQELERLEQQKVMGNRGDLGRDFS